ncbi:LOW QUALITY PROTEIN: V(D)J recombination-activating protein 2 [Bufo gargarizans]|uniref:LOW QUALITY PROTEIN: V(D)J recombination-activating protein 2 n=1 Tax=Bufo gargarizans TaxID=30331 RepID=UPI001CF5C4EA|nr:LOW QUALITY PROTEIN: V(D)J recombination-activating protein 2 [Bufo gargarizans]
MTLQTLVASNNTSLIQPGFSLFRLGRHVFFFGQKGWPKRSCPTGVFLVNLKNNELKLRPSTFNNESCYLPPLRHPAVTGLSDSSDGEVIQYLIHGGKTPNNEVSQKLYVISMASSVNKKITLCCTEKDLVGDTPEARYGHSINVVHSRGKKAVLIFGGRSYVPLNQRTTEKWNSVVDCQPFIYLIDLQFGCSTMHIVKEIQDGVSFHVSIARNDTVYIIGGHLLENNVRSPKIYKINVDLLLGSPAITCNILQSLLSFSSSIVTSTVHDEFFIVGGYESDSQKKMTSHKVFLSNDDIEFKEVEAPDWTGEIRHSKTWFGADMGHGTVLLVIPGDNKNQHSDSNFFFYLISHGEEDNLMAQSCSQGSLEDQEDSLPLEDSEEFMFNTDGLISDEDMYNEDDEEDESETGYWIKCCSDCNLDINTWVPFYSTELNKPAMIYCSSEGGHWVHAQCMDLSENMLVNLSENNIKYFCNEHIKLERGLQTPKKMTTVMKPSIKRVGRTSSISRMSPSKKSFLRRLFE